MERITLAPDYSISRVIKGSWQMSRGHIPGQEIAPDKAIADTLHFIREGITTLDFGDIYLGVEELVGECMKSLRAEYGSRARDMVQLHTKYVPDVGILPTHSFEDVKRIADRSCQRLGVDTLDLVQFHWWNYDVPGYVDAMLYLQRLQRAGQIRLVGVTNFDVERMREFVEAGVTPATIQLQYSVLDQRPAGEMTDFCKEHSISMLCYGTVAGGFLSEKYLCVPEPQSPMPNRSLTKYKLIIDEFGGWELFQEALRMLKMVADRHGASIATVASAYALRQPQVAGVIVGAHDRNHVAQNEEIGGIVFSDEEMAILGEVHGRAHGPKGGVYGSERNDPRHANIMHKANNTKA